MNLDDLHNFYLGKLKELLEICSHYGIQVLPAGGTLLGIVKYSDFIPWDDDVDLCILRSQYNKFLKLNKVFLSHGFILQNISLDRKFPFPYTKIIFSDHKVVAIKDETFSFDNYIIPFFDVYPIDDLGATHEKSLKKIKRVNFFKKIYEVRFCKINQITHPLKKILGVLVHCVPKSICVVLLNNSMRKKSKDCLFVTRWRGPDYSKQIINKSEISILKSAKLRGVDILIPENSDSLLKRVYGENFILDTPESHNLKHAIKNGSVSEYYYDNMMRK